MNKQELKDELVDLRMHLANAENRALKIIGKVAVKYYATDIWCLARNARKNIQEADNNTYDLAKLLGLDKLDLVEPKNKYSKQRRSNIERS